MKRRLFLKSAALGMVAAAPIAAPAIAQSMPGTPVSLISEATNASSGARSSAAARMTRTTQSRAGRKARGIMVS